MIGQGMTASCRLRGVVKRREDVPWERCQGALERRLVLRVLLCPGGQDGVGWESVMRKPSHPLSSKDQD